LYYRRDLSTVDDRPQLIHLNKHVTPQLCASCDKNPEAWKDLGRELLPVGDASEAALSTIAVNNKDDVAGGYSSLFLLWLERKPEANWKQLIDALKQVNLNSLAAKIEERLIPSVNLTCNTEDMIQLPHMLQSN